MTRNVSLLLAAIGLFLGGMLLGIFFERLGTMPSQQASPAEEIMARVGTTFIASTADEPGPQFGINFYALPKPFGKWLCRVDAVYVPPWIVEGNEKPSGRYYDDEIGISTLYGIVRKPSADVAETDMKDACANYRDFDHLISADDRSSPHRAVHVLDQILDGIESDQPRFAVTCSDISDNGRTQCDGVKAIKSLSLKQLSQTSAGGVSKEKTSTLMTDSLHFWINEKAEHPEAIELVVQSEQTIGRQSVDEPDVRSVQVNLISF